MSRRRAWAIAAVIMLLAGLGIGWWVGGSLLAPANHSLGLPPEEMGLWATTIPSQSGSHLAVWYRRAENSRGTVILLHPIRGDRKSMLDRARLVQEEGYSVVLVDLQAHGESQGNCITVGHHERHDVRAAVDFARGMNPEQPIGLIGWSLGGAAALLASPLDIDAIVLESVYPTISEAIHNRVRQRLGLLSHAVTPLLLGQLRMRLGISPSDLRPIDHVADVGCPILLACGSRDEHTSLIESQRLYDSAREPKSLVIFEDATHTDLLKYDPDLYRDQVLSFLDRHMAPAR